MRRLLLMSLAVSIAALMWSCKEKDVETGWGPGAPVVKIFGNMASAQGFTWRADSQIGIFCDQAFNGVSYGIGNYPLSVTDGGGTTQTEFVTTLKPGYNTNYFRAYYRYSDTVSQEAIKVKGSLPEIQNQTDATKSHLNNYAFLFASCPMTAIEGVQMKVDFNFKNLLSVIELTLTPNDPKMTGKVTSIDLTAPESNMLSGDFAADLSVEKVGAVFITKTSVNHVRMNLSDKAGTISNGQPIKAWITVAAVDLKGKTLAVSVKVDGRMLNYSVPGGNLRADEIYPISLELKE